MNPNEEKLKQLQAEIEAKKAEIAEIKAVDQKAKAEEMASTEPTAEQMALLSGIGLQGNRGADGSMITEEPVDINEVIAGINLKEGMNKGRKIIELGKATDKLGITRKELIMSPEFQAVYGNAYDDIVDPLEVNINLDQDAMTEEEIDAAADKKIQETMYDIDGNYRKDAKSAMMTDMGNPDQDRRMAMEDDIEARSMGFKADDSGNMSVDEKDDFWKTQEGYNKAMEMYGSKPAWIPDEPTLVFNPVTQEYEEIKDEDKEEFVDFSQPRMSADLKALLG